MTLFQILAIGVSLALAILISLGVVRRRVPTGGGLFWIILWLMAAVAFWRPGLTAIVANSLGILRGADFVFYCAIVAMLVGFFVVFSRLRRIENDLTELVRRMALSGSIDDPDER